jgi:hypothetical protein
MDDKHHSAKSKPVQMLAAQVMQRVNALSGQPPKQEMTVSEFWDTTFLPFIEKTKKASTINGYKKLWKARRSVSQGVQNLSGNGSPYFPG